MPAQRASIVLAVVAVLGPACVERSATTASPELELAPGPEEPEPAEPELRVVDLGLPRFTDPERRTKLEGAFAAIDVAMAERVELDELPGLALGIVIDGELAHARGFGYAERESQRPIDGQTVFRIGSITKLFTALRVVQLRDAGSLSLDDPVAEAVPALAGLVYPSADVRPITYADLLTHSSGISRLGYLPYWNTDGGPSAAELGASLDGFALVRAPGAGYEYSNFGYALLGLALMAHDEGRAATESITAALLEPLAMADTRWDPSGYAPDRLARGYEFGEVGLEPSEDWTMGAYAPVGGLYSTVEDLARFLAWQLDAWPPRSGPEDPILARASSREAQTIHYPYGGDRIGAKGVGWAWHGKHECYGRVLAHSGGVEGFAAYVALLPDHGVGVIVLSNTSRAKTAELSNRVLELLDETGGLRPRRLAFDPLVDEVSARLVAALAEFDDAVYTELAAPIVRKELELDELRARWAWWGDRLGACTRGEVLGVHAPNEVSYRLDCAAGRATIRVHVQVGMPEPLVGVRITSAAVEPSAEVVEAAGRVIALLDQWNDHGFEASFAPKWAKRGIEDFFGRVNARYGACTLGALREVRNPDEARFDLDCSEAPARMTLRLTEYGDGKIDSLSIHPAERGGPCG